MEQISPFGYVGEMIFQGLNQLLSFLMLIFYIVITIYAVNKFNSPATTLLIIGTTIKVLSFLIHLFLINFIVSLFDHQSIAGIFAVMGIFAVIGDFLFLFGIFKLFKLFYENNRLDE